MNTGPGPRPQPFMHQERAWLAARPLYVKVLLVVVAVVGLPMLPGGLLSGLGVRLLVRGGELGALTFLAGLAVFLCGIEVSLLVLAGLLT